MEGRGVQGWRLRCSLCPRLWGASSLPFPTAEGVQAGALWVSLPFGQGPCRKLCHSQAGGEEGEDESMAWADGLPARAADQRNSVLKAAVDPNHLHEFERRLGEAWKRGC